MRIAGIALVPVLTKTLGAYGYGLWAQVMATFSILFPVLSLGLPEAMTRNFPSKNINEIRDDFYSSFGIVIVITLTGSFLIYSFPNQLANAVFDGEVWVVRILAIIVFLRSIDNVLLLVFRAFREMKKHAVLSVVTKYGEIILAIILVLLGYGLLGALLALVIIRTSMLFVLGYLVGKKIPLIKPNFSSIKEYLHFGIPLVPKAVSTWIISTSDRYVIGFFLGATFVGYYAPSYSLGIAIPSAVGSIISFILPPALSEHYDNDNINLVNKIINLCNKYFLVVSIPYFLGVIILGYPILELFTDPEIAQNGYIIMIFSGVAGIVLTIKYTFQSILFLRKKTTYNMIAHISAAGVNLGGNIILVPRIGIIGAGITTVISYSISLTLIAYWSLKVKDFELRLGKLKLPVTKIIFSSSLMGIIIYFLYRFTPIHFLILVVLGIGIYFSILYAIDGIKKSEIDYLKNLKK